MLAVLVALLVEWSLSTPEVCGSSGTLYLLILTQKRRNLLKKSREWLIKKNLRNNYSSITMSVLFTKSETDYLPKTYFLVKQLLIIGIKLSLCYLVCSLCLAWTSI